MLSVDIYETINPIIKDIQEMGFSYATFGFKNLKTDHVIGVFSDKAWQKHYVGNKYFLDDPLLNTALDIKQQCLTWNAFSGEIMNKRNGMCHTRNGITYSYVKDDIISVIAVGSAEDENIFLRKYIGSFQNLLLLSNRIMSDAF
jgi:hypothetical protein